MGKFQVILLLSVVTCTIISTVQSVPVSDSSIESENAEKCKKLCGFCGCTGYYCGEECLCECNSATDGDAACVDTMKSNCKKLELPFEVLIQGPNANRMVRSLLYANPDEEVCVQSSESNQKKRATISIYKPNEIQQRDEILTLPKVDDAAEHLNDSPIIRIIVAQKTDKTVADVEPVKIEAISEDVATNEDIQTEENVENMNESAVDDTNTNAQNANQKLPVANDAVDRTNIKRHIIDVNQDISDYPGLVSDDGFLYKRDTEVPKAKDEIVAAPPPPPAPPVPPTPSLPKIRKIIDSIPTSDEIQSAWEAVRNEMNSKITASIAAAQQKASELRARFAKPAPPPTVPVPVAKVVPVPVVPVKPALQFPNFNKFDNNVGMALNPVGTLRPIGKLSPIGIESEFAKKIAEARAALLPNDIAKNLQAIEFKKRWNKDSWLTPWLVGSPNDVGAPAPVDPVAEEPTKP